MKKAGMLFLVMFLLFLPSALAEVAEEVEVFAEEEPGTVTAGESEEIPGDGAAGEGEENSGSGIAGEGEEKPGNGTAGEGEENPGAIIVEEIEENPEDDEIEEILSTLVYSSDPSELAEGYIYSVLPRKDIRLRFSYPSGWRRFAMDTPERNYYDLLRTFIEDVASTSGSQTSSVLTVDAKNIFTSPYTAEDLGVDRLFNDEGKVTAAAKDAVKNIYYTFVSRSHFLPIYYCLLADSPYEFYWLDTQVWFQTGDFKIAVGWYENNDSVILLRGSWTISFPVSRDYAEIPSGWDGNTMLTEIDTDRYGGVQRARNQINTIVSAVEGQSDYEKMKYYRDRIKELSTYNTTAQEAYGRGEIGYGDPWQLIWVFDGNPDTKVVCEGFAKAFNYLCDLGTTEPTYSMEIRGRMNGDSHMWNMVRIDGHNYLVDVTNDNANYDLFLAGIVEGSLETGYKVKRGNTELTYVYNMVTTPRDEEDLTMEEYSYREWMAATANAPDVQISSSKTWPGYGIAIKTESDGGKVPIDSVIVTIGEESETYDPENGILIFCFSEDTEISIAAVVEGKTTPTAEPVSVTVEEEIGSSFSLPAGAQIGFEAFAGINAELITVNGNTLVPGAFDPDVVLAVDEAEDWFNSGYSFVVKPALPDI